VTEINKAGEVVQVAAKPGYKSTEFWLSLLAMIITAVIASGMLDTESSMGKIVALGATVLTALGYTVGRSLVKSSAAKVGVLFLALMLPLQGCCPPGYIKASEVDGPIRRLVQRHAAYIESDAAYQDQNNAEAQLEKRVYLADGTVTIEVLDSAKAVGEAE
jgi:hypothetical protein